MALKYVRADRSIAGPVIIRFVNGFDSCTYMLTEDEALQLCDGLRRVLESPTQGEPKGENVIVMQN